MSGYVYVGESDGGRVIRTGTDALTQVTTASTESVLPYLETWDIQPLGPSGDCVFRSVVVAVTYSNGYAITVTPYVDGVAYESQSFSGSGSGKTAVTAWLRNARGATCRVVVQATSRTGDLRFEVTDLFYVPMRRIP